MRSAGRDVVNVADEQNSIAATAAAMRESREVIYKRALLPTQSRATPTF